MGPLKRSSLLIILNLLAVISYLLVSSASGALLHVSTSVFSSPDSREYRAVADWIFGARASADASAWRPYLYPLLIGAAERLGGIRGVWLLNVVLWFATLNVAAAAAGRFVKSNWAVAFVFLVLATNVSLIMLTFEGLTETTVVALLAVWTYGLSHLTRRFTPSQVAWVLLPVALLVVVKPEFEILLVVVIVVLVGGSIRGGAPAQSAIVMAACVIPVAIQLAINVHFNGYVGISNIGEKTFRGYFLSRLDVAIGQAGDVHLARLKMIGLSNAEAIRFVFDHFGTSVVVFLSTLKENLLAGSNFLSGHARIQHVIQATEAVFLALLLAMIPLVLVAMWKVRDGRLALLSIAALNIFVAGGLTFWQGDRITIVALPVWLIALTLAADQVFGGVFWKSPQRQARARPPLSVRTEAELGESERTPAGSGSPL